MVPFDILCVVSYHCLIVTLFAGRTVFEIFDFKNTVTLKRRLGSLKVIENDYLIHHL